MNGGSPPQRPGKLPPAARAQRCGSLQNFWVPGDWAYLTVLTVTVNNDNMRRGRHRLRHFGHATFTPGDGETDGRASTYTIDELAAAAGLPSRTVRHYQWVGALPPPERNGRVGLYRQAHLDRLRLIARLQERGLHLRAIRDALRQAAHRRLSLEEWLGIGEHLRTPWAHEAPLTLSEAEVCKLLGDRPPGFVARLERAGLLRRQGDRLAPAFVVRSPGLLDIGLRLHDAGVEIETAAEAATLIRKCMRRAAEDLVRHFAKRTGRGFARSRTAGDVGNALAALRAMGADAVHLVFAQEMERALRAAMAQGALPDAQGRPEPSDE
jgi:DNA-binding transcriptional MerR regulator